MGKIAILGGTSHIAKGLIYNFSRKEGFELFLFVRSKEKARKFIEEFCESKNVIVRDFPDFNNESYDVLINCIGISGAEDITGKINTIFELTEYSDNLILNYLRFQPTSLYINFSSGAVFGSEFNRPADESSQSKWEMNNVKETNYYGIAKLNSEAKHRSLRNLNIVDLRVYSYFSRFIDLKSKYLMSQIINCVKENKYFITDNCNIIRDYLSPDDLYQLVEKSIKKRNLNDVYDAYSLKPISKFEIVDCFAKNYGLKYEVKDNINLSSITGKKSNYYSINKKAEKIDYVPRKTSLDGIISECEKLFNR